MDRPKANKWQAIDSNRDVGDVGDKSRRWVSSEEIRTCSAVLPHSGCSAELPQGFAG